MCGLGKEVFLVKHAHSNWGTKLAGFGVSLFIFSMKSMRKKKIARFE